MLLVSEECAAAVQAVLLSAV
eukprot:COSAG06_NODE_19577_length_832_cov_0.862210_1_plen_20_part_10